MLTLDDTTENNINFLIKALDESYLFSRSNTYGTITYANENLCEISGYSQEELIGSPHSILRHPETPKATFIELWDTIQNGSVWHGVLRNRKKNGQSYYVDISIIPILDEHNQIKEFIGIRHEITDLILEQQKSQKLLRTSPILEIPNRSALLQDIKHQNILLAALLDIDSFRQINDFYGYEISDKLLLEVSREIQNQLSQNYSLYHLQSDQFVIVSSVLEESIFISKLVEIQNRLDEKRFIIEDKEIYITIKLVYAYEKAQCIMRSLEKVLDYARKHHQRFLKFSSKIDLTEHYNKNIIWMQKLKSAFKRDTIVPYFQPIYDIESNSIHRFEALVRLIDEDGSIIPPFYFLDAAKQSKQYDKLSRVMITKTLQYFRNKEYAFSVNISVSDIINLDFNRFLIEQVELFPRPSQITFEILESEGIANYEHVLSFIERIKSYGCLIAIDDFGSGYANFENLIKLNADIIKIDGSLIKNIHEDNDAYDIVDAIMSFAHKKKFIVIAEFVSNQEIFHTIKNLGIQYAQGFYIGKPDKQINLNAPHIFSRKNNAIKQLIYISKATQPFDEIEAKKLLDECWENNLANSITGMLIYFNGLFIQIIEGVPDSIDSVYKNIIQDPRHHEIKAIGESLDNKRLFKDWNMGTIEQNRLSRNLFENHGISADDSIYNESFESLRNLLTDLSEIL